MLYFSTSSQKGIVMEINNTFTSLVADLPYPAKKNVGLEPESLKKGEIAENSQALETLPSHENISHQETKNSSNSENKTSVNLLV